MNESIQGRRLAALAALTVLAGCSGSDAGPAPGHQVRPPMQVNKPTREMPVNPDPKLLPAELMDRLYADASTRSGLAKEQITLITAQSATWGDSSMGCPQPNVSYLQVVTHGHWVILRAGREDFDYRINQKQHFIRCTGATKQAPIVYPDNS